MERPRQGDQFTLDQRSERQCKEETRFTKTELRRIQTLLRIPDMMQTYGGDHFTGIEGLCILLYRPTGPLVYRRMQNTFHRDRGTTTRIFSCMLEWLDDHWSGILDWDQDRLTPNRLQAFVHAIDARSLQGHGGDMTSLDVFGFINGASRQVCRLAYEQRAVYSSYDNAHVQRYHVLITPDGIIVHVSRPQAGTCSDATIFADSTLHTWLERSAWASDGHPLKVLGDTAYACILLAYL
ncbi:hypothetical protein K457DRAFT_70832 [Linnemannia elongata AG-77]|uniref:DDE Tnp4 domain-containing protein n=1 Tax=Linnemannia elongata AG-77 TaxID=1314771 RepID=A0A197K4V3_9FUNG|nr:hypothetical protein K457DRAFT_70832 [Linnemannia elongata AG-77]